MNQKAFTLIELLVVVLIIGILAAVALPQYEKAVTKSKISEAVTAIRAIANAERIYFMANNTYSEAFDELDVSIGQTANTARRTMSFWDIKLTEMSGHYIFAGSTTDVSGSGYGEDRWYIYYHLDTDQFFCCAHKDSASKNKLCRSYTGNATAQGVTTDANLNCYPLSF